jgi:hypothetical protein
MRDAREDKPVCEDEGLGQSRNEIRRLLSDVLLKAGHY